MRFKSNSIKALKFILLFNLILFVYAILYTWTFSSSKRELTISASSSVERIDRLLLNINNNEEQRRRKQSVQRTILVICESYKSDLMRNILEVLLVMRFNYKLEVLNSSDDNDNRLLKLETKKNAIGLYSLIIFENLSLIDRIGSNNRLNLDVYTKKYRVGIIYFFSSSGDSNQQYQLIDRIEVTTEQIDEERLELGRCQLRNEDVDDSFYFITKFNGDENLLLKAGLNDSASFSSLERSIRIDSGCYGPLITCSSTGSNKLNVMLKSKDHCINRSRSILISINLRRLSINSLLLIDSIRFASYERITVDLDRYIQFDIDDIFVGPSGLKMKPDDVRDLIRFQHDLNAKYFNQSAAYDFRFNLGFCGYYFQSSENQLENQADQMLIDERNNFNWFEHGWFHSQPHQLNASLIKEQMLLNFHFATEHQLPIDSFYAVSPHHSGIYPAYEPLYRYWRKIWLIKATSTEGYPHFRPFYLRRGFIHDGIMVVPRQTCGIYTHTMFFANYPNGGIDRLNSMIQPGGETFKTVVYNRISIFMTHMTNYANDRLAFYLIENLLSTLHKWTNLRFRSLPPLNMAKKYFELYPNDREPLWTNACHDRRHLAIWSYNETECGRLPSLVILGPQKTGSTALHAFMKRHPLLRSNRETPGEHEETQFFMSKYYQNGPDWYMSLFPTDNNNSSNNSSSSIILFEKSANYFSEFKVPVRMKNLLGSNSKQVIITIDPADRAYSWYQHMRYRNDSVANELSFFELISIENLRDKTDSKKYRAALQLRSRCLEPGIYYKHLRNWLAHFDAANFHLVDGDLLRSRPNVVLDKLQRWLNLSEIIDFSKHLKFDSTKGYYCLLELTARETKRTKCLGTSKGKAYDKMDAKSRSYLNRYYHRANIQLYNLLKQKSFEIPEWLKRQVAL